MATTALQPWAASSWRAANAYTPAPSNQGDPTDWGVPHPPTPDTSVVQNMPSGYTAGPFIEELDYYGIASGGTYDATPGPGVGAAGIAMSSGSDWPSWEQP